MSSVPFLFGGSLLRQWIEDAKAGDHAAFERLLREHETVVLRTALRLLGNSAEAEDAAQEVFVRMYRKLRSFRSGSEFVPWLYRMTVNVCHDLRRKRRSVSVVDPEPSAAFANPEEALERDQQRALVIAALDCLTPKERAAIVLRDLEGQTTAEVAALLGTSEATVRSQISTGRLKIRSYVESRLKRTK